MGVLAEKLSPERGADIRVLDPYRIIDSPPEQEFDDITELAAAICEAPIAMISFVLPERQWFKSKVGISITETPIEQSFCAHAIAANDQRLFVVSDAQKDPRFLGNRLVTGAPHIRFYAGAPLSSRDGASFGTLCVIDTKPRADGLTGFEQHALLTLAGQVTAQLELRQLLEEQGRHVASQIKMTDEVRWLANHDTLTGLANRTQFHARLEEAIRCNPEDQRIALMFIDVDHFKLVNDTIGHDGGDELLKEISQRLKACVRSTDTVARWGGDEFVIILTGIKSERDVESISESIFSRLKDPIIYGFQSMHARVTIGGAVFPDHASSSTNLVQHADIALYAAKSAGRGRSLLFNPRMLAEAKKHVDMIDRARIAVAQETIVPFYQPKVDLKTRRPLGFEALLRIALPDGQVDTPSTIAAAFDDGELSIALGTQMMRKVAADMRGWLDAGLDFGRIAVNASASEFRDGAYAERTLAILAESGVPPTKLEVEITETVLLDRDGSSVWPALSLLVKAGVRIALDDFGTGYASLTHLNRFPVDVLKIDRSFVECIEFSDDNNIIVRTIIEMASRLNIDVVAEGIENEIQERFLLSQNCNIGQGYLYGKAFPSHEIPRFILSNIAQ